jgi:hypothetical protein
VDRDAAPEAGGRHAPPDRRHDHARAPDVARAAPARRRAAVRPARRPAGVRTLGDARVAIVACRSRWAAGCPATTRRSRASTCRNATASGCPKWISGTVSSSCANWAGRADGEPLAYESLTAIHWTHRVGALVTFLYVGGFAIALDARAGTEDSMAPCSRRCCSRRSGSASPTSLRGLPLVLAVAHNGVAAILLVTLVVINFALSRGSTFSR